MPLYYFDCYHASCHDECVGHDLPDQDAAHTTAIRFAGEVLQHEPHGLRDGHDLIVTVSDSRHLKLFSVVATSIASAATQH